MPRTIDEAKLFEVVINEWMAHGYGGCTTRDIANIAGVNEATLFRRYGSKAGLFTRAIDHQLADTPLALVCISGDLSTDLLALAEAYMDTYRLYGDVVFRAVQELPRYPEVREAASHFLGNIQKMVQLVLYYQQKGLLRVEHPLLTLTAFIGPIATFLMFARSGLSPEMPPFDVGSHISGFLHGRAE
ncbi:TetR/AcrR family transcriptional regulator [Microbulbifer variabilis]|uniref:TetR/AcrR family transcriptional regulator n=1 Tax=Microbulbifer variabilis TaxID=266805 RepID=UPI001CFF0B7D|nr:TetR/AcrR family transcriptional regulator [Microbulbifer variabilis]